MKNNQGYKNAALAALKGRWASVIVATIIFVAAVWAFVVPYVISDFAVQGLLQIDISICLILLLISFLSMLLLVAPLSVGYGNACLRLVADGDANVIGNLGKYAFKGYWRNIWGMVLAKIFVSLWSLLLLIPGIIKQYSYAMTPYLLKEYPELSANQCINLSKKMMKGHKFDLFYLHLSFAGWLCLVLLFTAGIGVLWLAPYMEASVAAFYQDVKADYAKNGII